MAALAIDKFDSALRGNGPGAAANLDALTIAGPAGTNGAVCGKCGSPATGALTDPKFEMERIEVINKILLESGVAQVPLKATDDAGWESESAPLAENAPQTTTPQAPQVAGVRFERIKDRELYDLANADFRDNEIL